MALCTFIKAGGDGCRTPALRGSKLCLFHDPQKEAERQAARSSGGKKNRPVALASDTPPLELSTRDGLTALVGSTINDVRCGRIDPKVGNAIGALVSIQMRLLDRGLEDRVATLERIVENRSKTVQNTLDDGEPIASLEKFEGD
jgi:hypothetical protein